MQHYDDMPKIPTITAEEAMKLSWLASSSETMKAVRELHLSILNAPSPIFTQSDEKISGTLIEL